MDSLEQRIIALNARTKKLDWELAKSQGRKQWLQFKINRVETQCYDLYTSD